LEVKAVELHSKDPENSIVGTSMVTTRVYAPHDGDGDGGDDDDDGIVRHCSLEPHCL